MSRKAIIAAYREVCQMETETHPFAAHVAKLVQPPGDPARCIVSFREPGKVSYAFFAELHHGFIFIWGDLGIAVYRFSESHTPAFFLNGLEVEYFEGKMVAGPRFARDRTYLVAWHLLALTRAAQELERTGQLERSKEIETAIAAGLLPPVKPEEPATNAKS